MLRADRELAFALLDVVGPLVDTPDDGARAIQLAGTRSYDIVVMDMQMPTADGLKATRKIQDEHSKHAISPASAEAAAGGCRLMAACDRFSGLFRAHQRHSISQGNSTN